MERDAHAESARLAAAVGELQATQSALVEARNDVAQLRATTHRLIAQLERLAESHKQSIDRSGAAARAPTRKVDNGPTGVAETRRKSSCSTCWPPTTASDAQRLSLCWPIWSAVARRR